MIFSETPKSGCGANLCAAIMRAAITLAVIVLPALSAQAQTFTVIQTFSGGSRAGPSAGLTIDGAGNFYGTTTGYPFGSVYKLAHSGSGWILTPIYEFKGQPDGNYPQARVVFGPDGALYGTTAGGGAKNQGTVFRLTPPPTNCKSTACAWHETILYSFQNLPDGENPGTGDVIFDAAGNLYGTTEYGGLSVEGCAESPCGTVYELSPAGGGWEEKVIYQFSPNIGFRPLAGVIRDSANNLYGTTTNANDGGLVYELTPLGNGQWMERTVYNPHQSPGDPAGGLIFDSAGNLYGTYALGGTGVGGIVFELAGSGGHWNLDVLYNFINPEGMDTGPQASLTMDAAGNLYGTTYADGAFGCGSVFKLTPSHGSWTYTSLHDFTCLGGGGYPISNVTLDSAGNLYGTASRGGAYNAGLIWEIAP